MNSQVVKDRKDASEKEEEVEDKEEAEVRPMSDVNEDTFTPEVCCFWIYIIMDFFRVLFSSKFGICTFEIEN